MTRDLTTRRGPGPAHNGGPPHVAQHTLAVTSGRANRRRNYESWINSRRASQFAEFAGCRRCLGLDFTFTPQRKA
jgi:hypothetical protein